MPSFSIAQPTPNSLKQRAKELLAGIPGIQGIGFGWDNSGNSILQIDLASNTDRAAIEQKLLPLDTSVRFRVVQGTIKRN
jgi:hypothetical protein